MKINILSVLILTFLFINVSIAQEKNEDVGYWTVLVNYRYKQEFKTNKDAILKDIPSIAKRHQLEDEDTEVTHKGYTIKIMSKRKVDKGLVWPKIGYIH